MKIDLAAAAAQIMNATGGKIRAEWTGGKIEIDETELIQQLSNAVAAAMGANLYKGLRPDGSGPMPGRKEDGKPRGFRSAISRALRAVRQGGDLSFLIAAHKENPGHLKRIMQGIPFAAPPLAAMQVAISKAFARAVHVSQLGAQGRALREANLASRLDATTGRLRKRTRFADLLAPPTPRGPYAKTLRGQYLRHKIAKRAREKYARTLRKYSLAGQAVGR